MKTKPVAAILYDFDKTLSTKDMQEYAFIPGIGMTAVERVSGMAAAASLPNCFSARRRPSSGRKRRSP